LNLAEVFSLSSDAPFEKSATSVAGEYSIVLPRTSVTTNTARYIEDPAYKPKFEKNLQKKQEYKNPELFLELIKLSLKITTN